MADPDPKTNDPATTTPPPAPPASKRKAADDDDEPMPKVGDTVVYTALTNGPSTMPLAAKLQKLNAKTGTADLLVYMPNGEEQLMPNVPAHTERMPHNCWSAKRK